MASIIDSILDNTSSDSSPPSTQPAPRRVGDMTGLASRDRDREEWIDDTAKARIQRDIDLARANGFATGVTAYAVGTVVNSTGVENARAKRLDFEALPLAGSALLALERQVKGEDREDRTVAIASLRMQQDGVIRSADNWTLERDCLGPLAARIASAHDPECRPASLGSYLESCPAPLRALNFNVWTESADDDAKVKLRTRIGQGGDRGVFAVVSEKYPAVDVDEVASMAREALNGAGMDGSMRARVDYDGRKVKIDLESHSNVPAESYAAGEIFRAFVRLTTDDTGSGAITGDAGIEQNLCRNLIILHTGTKNVLRLVHRGNRKQIVAELRYGIRKALDSVSVFSRQWSDACRTSVLDLCDWEQARSMIDKTNVEQVMAATFAAMIASESIPVGSGQVASRVRSTVPILLAEYRRDVNDGSAAVQKHKGGTLAAVVNAVTRYAQGVADPFAQDDIERAGGRLLSRPTERFRLPTAEEFLSWQTSPEMLVVEAGRVQA